MKSKFNLAAVSFGAFESAFGFIILALLLGGLLDEILGPIVLDLFLLFLAICVTIWQAFNRISAIAYLIGLLARVLFLASTTILLQEGFLIFNYESTNIHWVLIAIFVSLVTIVRHYQLESTKWDHTLEVWSRIRKINVSKGYFRICEMFHADEIRFPKYYRFYFAILPIGYLVLRLVFNVTDEIIQQSFCRLGFIFLSYILSTFVGKILLWLREIKKLEYKMGIEFLTEYVQVRKV